ncbi:MAG TPA: TIGR00730 family Rossman fold protein [Anaerolineales bacterium]|nr:TIGR00730 family Rossman fold protein [Anaerolineales bacterium]
MKRICVFCGSSPGRGPQYIQAAKLLGYALASKNLGLVYGGAKVGMMGRIAESVLEKGGEVIGVIPKGLVEREVAFTGLSDLRVVGSMHERKALMAELSDGFIALPGGLGTIEEFLEVVTWAQLGIHAKPCGLLNVEQYYNSLLDFLDHTVSEQFVEGEHRSMILVDENPERLLQKFETYQPPTVDKAQWVLRFLNTKT